MERQREVLVGLDRYANSDPAPLGSRNAALLKTQL